jgi:hypothetical protein
MAGVVVHVDARPVREHALAVVPAAPERDVGELAEALRVDVLELAVDGVPGGELELAREALREREAAVDEAGALRVQPLLEPGGGEAGPAALHLHAREALLGDRVERAPGVVDRDDARFVAAVVSDPHGRAFPLGSPSPEPG